MADIKQAARWLLEGHQVYRTNAKKEQHLFQHPIGKGLIKTDWREAGFFAHFMPDDLLADDWEIVD